MGSVGTTSPLVNDRETDVLVVGAGVAGLTLSVLLAQYGIRTLTVAKHSGTAPQPRAHVTNQRTMEVFRDMGIEDRVVEQAIRMTEVGSGVMLTSLTGLEIARYACYGAGDDQMSDFTAASPCAMMNIPQNLLEQILYSRLRELGGDVHFYQEVIDVTQDTDHASATVRDRHTHDCYNVRAQFVVAADGGRSLIAEKLGIGFIGQPGLMSMLTTWLEMDLEQQLVLGSSGTLIIVRRWDQWLLNRQYDAADGEPDTSDEAVIAHARKVLNIPQDLPIKVKDSSKWQVNNLVATTYQHGRIFLAGDAAHRHPPSSGLGSNTCVQDAYNIAWKLALVVKGKASEKLLESYTQERQPIGKQVVDHAIQTLYNWAMVPTTLGFKKGQSLEEGFESLEHLFSDALEAEDRRAELEKVVKLQDRRSNAIGLHLGQRYSDSRAVVDDGTPFPEYERDPVLHYEPTTHTGAYLPHAWVSYQGKRVSTLDIIPHGLFGLICGIRGKLWRQAAQDVERELGLELPTYSVGYRCEYDDVFGLWSKRKEMKDDGVLVVRPDRHIAFRSVTMAADPYNVLKSAILHVLNWNKA
ncbi:2,4-dichlorophenol 6-monooxygenase [Cyphellophora attinorum]|uniref:2,4-dichlorophenol 6-monooxygenase n=1 Tax=Cyphellophora attinorum TaxID=1664694 RepID=A0A0N1H561_9EURO|nr:2,4-dichlorophenol 6-monooxygenase [Phialophora attinorum]KPI40697.1 2,4-dichlorophenol 6-monooxygenase [Phialophora attinorum]